jgi:hypothetical protein
MAPTAYTYPAAALRVYAVTVTFVMLLDEISKGGISQEKLLSLSARDK